MAFWTLSYIFNYSIVKKICSTGSLNRLVSVLQNLYLFFFNKVFETIVIINIHYTLVFLAKLFIIWNKTWKRIIKDLWNNHNSKWNIARQTTILSLSFDMSIVICSQLILSVIN